MLGMATGGMRFRSSDSLRAAFFVLSSHFLLGCRVATVRFVFGVDVAIRTGFPATDRLLLSGPATVRFVVGIGVDVATGTG